MRLADLQEDWFEEGALQMLLKLVSSGQLPFTSAIDESGLSEEEFTAALERYKENN